MKIARLGPRRNMAWSRAMCDFTRIHKWEENTSADTEAARILAAEVERLRAEMERRGAAYNKALNKRVDVENELARAGAGKRELPTREECTAWALKLGNS